MKRNRLSKDLGKLASLLGIVGWVAACLLPASSMAAEAAAKAPRKTAIFVENRAGRSLDNKILFFEDQVSARAAGKNFAIISREEVLKAVKVYPLEQSGPQAASAQASVESLTVKGPASSLTTSKSKAEVAVATPADQNEAANRNALGVRADRILSDNSSALRLAQSMGADFLLVVAVGSYAREVKNFEDPSIGIKVQNIVYNLRGTYKVLEGVTGGALGGDAFRTSKTVRQTSNLQTGDEDTVNALLEEAAGRIAEGLEAKASQFVPLAQSGKVEIAITCGVKDLAGNEVTIPDIRLTEDNKMVKAEKEIPVQASATIEIDGFAMGTTPSTIKVAPGSHKLRLTRPGFADVELSIIAAEGLRLSLTMQMSAEGFERWKNIRDYLNKLDITRKVTDAQAEEIRGNAQRLRQSGILVDYRVNTTEAPKVVSKRSIYSIDD